MEKILPEIIFSSSDSSVGRRIKRDLNKGLLRQILPRVYTSNLEDADETIIARNLYPILGKLYPEAIISHRSALEGGVSVDGNLYLTYSYNRKVELPGITIHLLKGAKFLHDDMPFVGGLFLSSQARAFLENFQISRGRNGIFKTLSKAELEDRLDGLCRVRGEGALNTLRDQARLVADALDMPREFDLLNQTISAILRTHPSKKLSSSVAQARSQGLPYDAARVDLFTKLMQTLAIKPLPTRKDLIQSANEAQNFSFFEAYFSNYIEGTEFEVGEAHDIVLHSRIPVQRPKDSHDILGTYKVVSNLSELRRETTRYEYFIDVLKARHSIIMEGRPEVSPGEFKLKANQAGQTHFVEPELVRGTLQQGFEMSGAIERGLARALFIMFVISEVHPFVDGNGRIARIMMNAELVQSGLSKIILPTVMRDDYLRTLRLLSREGNADAFIEVMDFAQQFSAELTYSSYEETLNLLKRCHAFDEPDEGHLKLPSLL